MERTTNDLLTVSEAAQMLGVSKSRAYVMARRGEIPTLDLGPRSLRVPRAALEAWIRERTEPSAHPSLK